MKQILAVFAEAWAYTTFSLGDGRPSGGSEERQRHRFEMLDSIRSVSYITTPQHSTLEVFKEMWDEKSTEFQNSFKIQAQIHISEQRTSGEGNYCYEETLVWTLLSMQGLRSTPFSFWTWAWNSICFLEICLYPERIMIVTRRIIPKSRSTYGGKLGTRLFPKSL